MECPYCKSEENKVVDKRSADNDSIFRRRRECISCEKRFTTYERIEDSTLSVIKKDGRKESFDRDKLRFGLTQALGRNSDADVEKLVVSLEQKMRNYKTSAIESKVLGRWVLQALRKTDKLAYLRFASVHKDNIEDLEDLKEEIDKIA